MRVGNRFFLVMALSVASLFSTVAVAVWTVSEYRAINRTTRDGLQLISDARRVHVLMKDMLVGVFTPRTYGVLKDLVHFESFNTTRRTWEQALEQFFREYAAYLERPRLLRLVASNPRLKEEHAVALRLLGRTDEMVVSLRRRLDELEVRGILGREDTYYLIQRAADPEVVPVFNEIRETSFYLTNTFESFLEHFATSLERRAQEMQRRLLWGMGVFAATIGIILLAGSWLLSRTIVRNVHALAGAMEALSRGDFAARPAIRSRDEFGELSENFAGFMRDLRRNVNLVLDLQQNLQNLAGNERPVQEIYPLVCRTARTGIGADTVAIIDVGRESAVAIEGNPAHTTYLRECVQQTVNGDRQNSARTVVVAIDSGHRLFLALYRAENHFTELEQTILNSYGEFSQLLIENHVRYTELLERRNAQYEALQAQIRPHFLYNVLNNIIGLNRMNDRDRLEAAIVALKDILHFSLGQERTSRLGDEVTIARRYCSLQQLRFEERITFDISCPPEIADVPVPKLILQPLVENAIIHGLEPKPTPGHLWLYARRRDASHIDVIVEDDGVGMPDSTEGVPAQSSSEQGHSIGLRNIEQRLRIAYDDATLQIESRLPMGSTGTRCTVTIPNELESSACVS